MEKKNFFVTGGQYIVNLKLVGEVIMGPKIRLEGGYGNTTDDRIKVEV